MLVPAVVSAQQKPATGRAPVSALKMHYEIHGNGEPVVLLHGAFMTITINRTGCKGSPIEAAYKKLSQMPEEFPKFVKRVVATASKGHDLGTYKLKATTAPMFFFDDDADGVRLEDVAEMIRLKGGEIHGDMKPRSASRLAILPNTTALYFMCRLSRSECFSSNHATSPSSPGCL